MKIIIIYLLECIVILVLIADFYGFLYIQILLKHGSNINVIDNKTCNNEYTPLISAIDGGHVPVIEELLSQGADPNIIAPSGDDTVWYCPLHFAAIYEPAPENPEINYTMMRLLLLSGANVKFKELVEAHPDIKIIRDGNGGEECGEKEEDDEKAYRVAEGDIQSALEMMCMDGFVNDS